MATLNSAGLAPACRRVRTCSASRSMASAAVAPSAVRPTERPPAPVARYPLPLNGSMMTGTSTAPLFTTRSNLTHSTSVMTGREWYRARQFVRLHSRKTSRARFPATPRRRIATQRSRRPSFSLMRAPRSRNRSRTGFKASTRARFVSSRGSSRSLNNSSVPSPWLRM